MTSESDPYDAAMSRWLPFRRDLGLQLLALYLLFVTPVIAAALTFDNLAGARLESDVEAADLALAQSIALETDATLRNAMNTVLELSRTPEVQSGKLGGMAPLFAAVSKARSEINLVYLLDAQGTMVYHYPEGPSTTVGTDFSFRDYFQAAHTAHEPLMSIGRVSPTTNQPVTTAVMPIRDPDGDFRGVVATNLALERLSFTLSRIASKSTSGLRVSILNSAGTTVAASDLATLLTDSGASLPADLASLLGSQPASVIGADASGREWLRTYVSIPSAAWAVVVQRPIDVAFASATSSTPACSLPAWCSSWGACCSGSCCPAGSSVPLSASPSSVEPSAIETKPPMAAGALPISPACSLGATRSGT